MNDIVGLGYIPQLTLPDRSPDGDARRGAERKGGERSAARLAGIHPRGVRTHLVRIRTSCICAYVCMLAK